MPAACNHSFSGLLSIEHSAERQLRLEGHPVEGGLEAGAFNRAFSRKAIETQQFDTLTAAHAAAFNRAFSRKAIETPYAVARRAVARTMLSIEHSAERQLRLVDAIARIDHARRGFQSSIQPKGN